MAAVVGPRFLGGVGRPPFVRVVCTPWVGAQPWFAPTNKTLVQGQVFEDDPQLSKGLIPASGSTPFVPATAGTLVVFLTPCTT